MQVTFSAATITQKSDDFESTSVQLSSIIFSKFAPGREKEKSQLYISNLIMPVPN